MRFRNFQQIQTQLQKKLTKKFTQNFSKLTNVVEDFADQLDSHQSKQFLNFALDLIKPYLKVLGLRVSKLSEGRIEVVLPYKVINATSDLQHDEGAISSAAIFAYRTLWKKNSPKGLLKIQIKKTEFEFVRLGRGTLYLRMELPALTREAIFAELADDKFTNQESTILVYDSQEQIVAQVVIRAYLTLQVFLHEPRHESLKRK